jgi:DNA end-binding protein Ku
LLTQKLGDFKPEKFEDQYEDAVRELLKKKQEGVKIEAPRGHEPAKVINLIDALRRSVEAERSAGEKRAPSPSVHEARRKSRPGRALGTSGQAKPV